MFESVGALTENELSAFIDFQAADLALNDDRETSRTKPYQIQSLLAPSSESEANLSSATSRPGGSAEYRHAMRSHFIKTTPKYMRCTDRLDFGSSMEKKSRALNCKYVQPNSTNRIAWQIFDLDFSGAANAFDEANVVVPNFIAENPSNGHAHYGYAFEAPISTGERSRPGPVNFLKAVRAGMTRRLGADPNFRHGLGKNPLHSDWRTTWLVTKPYNLHDMAAFLDADDMRPVHRSKAEENEFAQRGRNCALTSDLGKYALRTAWRFRREGASLESFLRELRAHAFELNNGFGDPLGFREVQIIAKSVAKWAWSESTFEKFSEIQRHRAQARTRRNLVLLAEAPDLQNLSVPQVALILGRSTRTARRYVGTPRAEYEGNSISRAIPWQDLGISRATYYRRKKSNASD